MPEPSNPLEPNPLESDPVESDPDEGIRKPWTRPTLFTAEIAELTNKKSVTPSDGTGTHTAS